MNTQNRRRFLKSLGVIAAGGLMMGGAALAATKQFKEDHRWLTKEEFLAKLDRQNNRIVGEIVKINFGGGIDLSSRRNLVIKNSIFEFKGRGRLCFNKLDKGNKRIMEGIKSISHY